MAKTGNVKAYNNFIRGIITEATALTFPENASIDESNFILDRDGSRKRRLGIDYENLFSLIDTNKDEIVIQDDAVNTFKWDNVANDSSKSIGVIQIGTTLWLLDLTVGNPSATVLNGGDPVTVGTVGDRQYQFTNLNGGLLIANGETKPQLLRYDYANSAAYLSDITLKIRDLIGVYDALPSEENPTTLTEVHKYNLLNQGWSVDRIEAYFTASGAYPSNAQVWHVAKDVNDDFDPDLLDKQDFGIADAPKGRFIIDAFNRGADRQLQSTEVKSTYTMSARIGGTLIVDLDHGDTLNHKVTREGITDWQFWDNVSALEWTVSVGTGVGGVDQLIFSADNENARVNISYTIAEGDALTIPTDIETGKISTISSHAGRVFYAGISSSVIDGDLLSPNYSGYVFFSTIVATDEQLGHCYQEADPTSDQISDLIDTDGGTIPIPDAHNILKLVHVGEHLVIFAENGVWQIYGGDGGFIATEYQVSKITNIGAVNAGSIVEVEGVVYYWSKGGIYVLEKDQISDNYVSKAVSETTIQSLYTAIPNDVKVNTVSNYDATSKKVTWLYNTEDDYDGIKFKHRYNTELILDGVTGAFSKNDISQITGGPYVAGYLQTPDFINVSDVQRVTVNGDPVVVNGEEVVVTRTVKGRSASVTKYVTIVPDTTYDLTLSFYKNPDFIDWEEYDNTGVDYTSYLITGYELLGDIAREKQIPYILFYFNRTEDGFIQTGTALDATKPSSCLVQGRWGWTNSVESGRWTSSFQAYRYPRPYTPTGVGDDYDTGDSVIITKNKLRGRGKSFSLYISSETGKDMQLLGWAVSATGGTVV